MSVGDITPIPEGFLARLLQEFGIGWTNLVIISGVVFSSFGLQEYLNPGVWILGTVASFSLVYLFRLRITGNFPKVAFWTGLAGLAGLAIPLIILHENGGHVAEFLKAWTVAATFYISVIIGIPVGTAILSYRAQEEFLRDPLPPVLEKAARESVSQTDFVYERATYRIKFTPSAKGDVVMQFDVTMDVANRLKRPATYLGVFDPAGREKRFLYVAINGSQIDEQDPERLSQRGLLLSYEAEANEKFQVVVSGESTFHSRDSEIVGVYRPCACLSVLILKPPDNLAVHVQCLMRKKVDPKRLPTGNLLVECAEGVLPFQGVRLFWEPRC